MLFEPKTVTLKDGRACLLRSPLPEDAAAMLHYLKTSAAETDFLLRYPEECTETEEAEIAFLTKVNESSDSLMIVAIVDGALAGNCRITFMNRIKTAHRAGIGIALTHEFWGLGIGTAMFHELIRAAKERGTTQLELEFIEGNTRGQRLYEKMGFQIVAEIPNAIRLKDGTLLKEYTMVKPL
ncbi:MAG: GNAT family N-acetyltransferase [Clostridia bacterium]|nr:GNAT family N-acetyltransferase [Clostridia bacterium]